MKKKAMAGGAVGLVLLGAYFLGNLFNGWGGFGTGKGDGTGKGTSDPSKIINSTEEPDTQPVSKVNPPGVELGKVVVVLIDGEEYKVLKSPNADSYDPKDYRPATLDYIVKMAKDVEGDAGIKVRIGMRSTSTPKSERELQKALTEAGLKPREILVKDETIP